MSFLAEILRHKRAEVAGRKSAAGLSQFKARIADLEPARGFEAALARRAGEPLRLIAEVKKASPSKGLIRADFDPVRIADRGHDVAEIEPAYAQWNARFDESDRLVPELATV